MRSSSKQTARRALGAVLLATATAQLPAQPATPRRPVTDRYPGLTVVDPYRWMERAPSPAFTQWLREQNEYTTSLVAGLPGRDALAARIRSAARPDDAPRRMRRGGQRLVYFKRDADSLPPTLRTFDLETLTETSVPVSLPVARHDPSPDGRWLAITGAGDGRVRLLSIPDGRVVDSLPKAARFAGWHPDAATLFYQHIVRGQSVVRARRVGPAAAEDEVALRAGQGGSPRWRVDDVLVWLSSPDGKEVALQVVRDESVTALHLRSAAGGWRSLATANAEVTGAAWHGGSLFVLGASGLMRVDPVTAKIDTVRRSDGRALLGIAAARDALYLLEGTGGYASLWKWRAASAVPDSVPLPFAGGGRTLFAASGIGGVVLPIDGWLSDGGWYRVGEESAARLPLTASPRFDDRFVVERHLVRSFDATPVPLTLIRRRDLAPGRARLTWVTAYGAYGIAMTPLYQALGPALVPFLEDGGVYVMTHVRGGGEFGRAWHEGARAGTKSNGYRDLIACVEELVARGFAEPARLVIEGASGGGATVGMAGVTRPELFRVVVTNVPDANTLRLHATPDGPFMREEWGDIRTRNGTRALAAMDVTNHVQQGTSYPAWWATTGLQDVSVPPWQPAKLIAHLQATRSTRPAVLRVFPDEGHVLRPAAGLAQVIDMLSFALWQSGAPDFQPPPR